MALFELFKFQFVFFKNALRWSVKLHHDLACPPSIKWVIDRNTSMTHGSCRTCVISQSRLYIEYGKETGTEERNGDRSRKETGTGPILFGTLHTLRKKLLDHVESFVWRPVTVALFCGSGKWRSTTAQREAAESFRKRKPYAGCGFNFSRCLSSSSSLAKPMK